MRITTVFPLFACILLGIGGISRPAVAEPYLAVQQGLKCMQCHVNPSGGGLRNSYGNAFAMTQLSAKTIETGANAWLGKLGDWLSLGADLRADASVNNIPNHEQTRAFELEQIRMYLDFSVIPERLGLYVDELLAPGAASNREAYARYWSSTHDWYVKAGQMYLPFGLRLQDDSAFTRQLAGINMTTPDNGVEFGYEHGPWSVQLAVSNGSAGGPETNAGKQYSLQGNYVLSRWRIGAAANLNDSDLGDRRAFGVFAGVRTGPFAWLAEVDQVVDEGLSGGNRKLYAGLLEANWQVLKGHNLKATAELFDPDADVSHDNQARWSVLYEFTPIQFLQLRGGARFYDGIPQNDLQNRRLFFLEVHAFY